MTGIRGLVGMAISLAGIGLVAMIHGCSEPSSTTEARRSLPVDFTVYAGYSYRGPRAQSDTTFCYCTTSKAGFDSLFFCIPEYCTPIPAADLMTKKAISIVKYGDDWRILSIKRMSLRDGVLRVVYSDSLIEENMHWIAAIPIIAITDADFERIKFIEYERFAGQTSPED
jgi:hypothetical protein